MQSLAEEAFVVTVVHRKWTNGYLVELAKVVNTTGSIPRSMIDFDPKKDKWFFDKYSSILRD